MKDRYRLRADAPVRNAWPTLGADGPPLDDPAELFHEASKAQESAASTVDVYGSDIRLAMSVRRGVKRYLGAPLVVLPPPELPDVSFKDLIANRRSRRAFGGGPIGLAQVSALLLSSYGVTGQLAEQKEDAAPQLLRAVPSGGALYPLDVYIAALRVEGLDEAIYHFDPHDHVLEKIRLRENAAQDALAILYPEGSDTAAAAVIVTGVFWRNRFKYGLRGYRFALFEAGHLMQNLVLAATAFDLAHLPLGGFVDRRLEDCLKIDGVNESVLYAACLGTMSLDRQL